jgi:hypothetical protein
MREVAKMGYLWDHPMELVDPRLDAILGEGFATLFETAVATSIADLLPQRALAA